MMGWDSSPRRATRDVVRTKMARTSLCDNRTDDLITPCSTGGFTVSRRAESAVRMLVAFGEDEEDHFLASVVDVVQQAVGAYAKPILCGKL
jgi:hypothetical protein